MNLTAFIDVAIGLALVYLGASLFVTIANEATAQWLNRRGKCLRQSLDKLLEIGMLRALAQTSPLVQGLLDQPRMPSYVDTTALAQGLIGRLCAANDGKISMTDLIFALRLLPNTRLRAVMLGQAALSSNLADFVQNFATWLENGLSQLGEDYKRHSQHASFVIGLGIAILFNIDSLALVQRLYSDNALRNETVAAATLLVTKVTPETMAACEKMSRTAPEYASKCQEVAALGDGLRQRSGIWSKLPIGWTGGWTEFCTKLKAWDSAAFWLSLVGWVMTGVAVSFGAPFWFDLLARFVAIRNPASKPAT